MDATKAFLEIEFQEMGLRLRELEAKEDRTLALEAEIARLRTEAGRPASVAVAVAHVRDELSRFLEVWPTTKYNG